MKDDIIKAIDLLGKGGVILYPTDTIWGLGCDATNEEAVKKIYQIKKRVETKAMIILLDNDVKLNYYLEEIPSLAYDLIDLSEKPLTIIYDKARNLASNLVAEDQSIGIRITQEKFSHELCYRFKKAIVSTSANISGSLSPACFNEITKDIIDSVDYVVEYRQDEKNAKQPSSIIKLGVNNEIKIIRQ